MSNERKHINFTIVPDETGARERVYANFCAISHTPFDFTLTFCEVMPLSEKDLRQAQTDQVLRAPVRARVAIPVQLMPNLIAALQDHGICRIVRSRRRRNRPTRETGALV